VSDVDFSDDYFGTLPKDGLEYADANLEDGILGR
jgi:hypothetical protein